MNMPNQNEYVYEWSYNKSFEELQALPSGGTLGALKMYDVKQPVVTVSVSGEKLDASVANTLMNSLGSIVTIGDVTGLLTSLSTSQVKGAPYVNIKASIRVQS